MENHSDVIKKMLGKVYRKEVADNLLFTSDTFRYGISELIEQFSFKDGFIYVTGKRVNDVQVDCDMAMIFADSNLIVVEFENIYSYTTGPDMNIQFFKNIKVDKISFNNESTFSYKPVDLSLTINGSNFIFNQEDEVSSGSLKEFIKQLYNY